MQRKYECLKFRIFERPHVVSGKEAIKDDKASRESEAQNRLLYIHELQWNLPDWLVSRRESVHRYARKYKRPFLRALVTNSALPMGSSRRDDFRSTTYDCCARKRRWGTGFGDICQLCASCRKRDVYATHWGRIRTTRFVQIVNAIKSYTMLRKRFRTHHYAS